MAEMIGEITRNEETGESTDPSAHKRIRLEFQHSACDKTVPSEPPGNEPESFQKERFVIHDLVLDLFQGLPTGSDCDGTGGFIWEAGICLSEYLRSNRAELQLNSKHILELGSGSGLAGITSAACGACRVVLTDLDQMIPHIQRNVDLHGEKYSGKVEVMSLDWDKCDSCLHAGFDMVIGADLLYDSMSGSCEGM
jgi:hypothetical protein